MDDENRWWNKTRKKIPKSINKTSHLTNWTAITFNSKQNIEFNYHHLSKYLFEILNMHTEYIVTVIMAGEPSVVGKG